MRPLRAMITLECDAPDDADAWELVRAMTTLAAVELARRGCYSVRPEIMNVTLGGKRVTFKPRRLSK